MRGCLKQLQHRSYPYAVFLYVLCIGCFGNFYVFLQKAIKYSLNRLYSSNLVAFGFPTSAAQRRRARDAGRRRALEHSRAWQRALKSPARPAPLTSRTVWSTADLAADRSWEYHLSAGHRAELDTAVTAVTGADGTVRPVSFTATISSFPPWPPRLTDIYRQLKDGRGFAVLRDSGHQRPLPGPGWPPCCGGLAVISARALSKISTAT